MIKGNDFRKCLFLPIFFIFLLVFSACDNPFINDILEIKVITFNTNGGSHVNSQRVFRGETIRVPYDPTRPRFNFMGWFVDDETFLYEWDFDIIPENDLTLYAKWENNGVALTPEDIVFGPVIMNYEPQSPQTVTVTNIATRPTGPLTIQLSGENAQVFVISKDSFDNIELGDIETFTVTPVNDLLPGIYSAVVSVTGANNINGSASLTFIVDPIPITGVNVYDITAPLFKETPSTFASVNSDDNYSIASVSWNPDDGRFHHGRIYTIDIVLSAKTNYAFASSEFSAVLNNELNAAVSNNTGANVTISYSFPAVQLFKAVSAISIFSRPSKMEYIHGETINLTSLSATLTYDDNSTETVQLNDFALYGISPLLDNAGLSGSAVLSYSRDNGKTLTVSIQNMVSPALPSNNLTISRRTVTVTSPTAANKEYDGSAAAVITNPPVLSNIATGDDVTIIYGPAYFNNKNAGNNKPITFDSWQLGGNDAGNYNPITHPNITANITRKEISVSSITHTKEHDGNTSADVNPANVSLFGYVSGETVSVTSITAVYTGTVIGTETMNVSALTLNDSVNYFITLPANNIPVVGGITDKKIIIRMTIMSQPATVSYASGDPLNLSGLVIRLSYNFGDDLDVTASEFAANKITPTIPNGTVLKRSEHNNESIRVTYDEDTAIQVILNRILVSKGNGSAVNAFSVPVSGSNPYIINTDPTNIATGQSVEYARSIIDNAAPEQLSWQGSGEFPLVTAGIYYFYARSRENDDYKAGEIRQGTGSITFP